MKEYEVIKEFRLMDIIERIDVCRTAEREIIEFTHHTEDLCLTDTICEDGEDDFSLNVFDRLFAGTNGIEWLIEKGYIKERVDSNIVRIRDMRPEQIGIAENGDIIKRCKNVNIEDIYAPWINITLGRGYNKDDARLNDKVRLCEIEIREKVEDEIIIDNFKFKESKNECPLDSVNCDDCPFEADCYMGHNGFLNYDLKLIATPK